MEDYAYLENIVIGLAVIVKNHPIPELKNKGIRLLFISKQFRYNISKYDSNSDFHYRIAIANSSNNSRYI